MEPPAPGIPPVPYLQTLQELRRGLPQAAAPGMLPNRPPVQQAVEPAAPGVPSPPINIPFPNRAAPAPPAPPPMQAAEPSAPGVPARPRNVPPSSYGLTNFQAAGPDIPAVFENTRAQSQSAALNPTFQPTPLIAPNSPHATASPYGSPPPQLPAQSYADQWKNLIPTGPQFSSFGGPADPRGGPVDGPVPSWFGNAQREIGNKVFEGVGTAIDRTAREVNAIAGAPFKLAHQLFTPGVQLAEEQAVAQAQEVASQPPAAPQKVFHLQPPPQLTPSSIPSPTPTVAAPGTMPAQAAGTTPAPVAGTTGAASTLPPSQNAVPAAPGNWNALPPAALEMAQQFQAMGYSPLEIAGILGQSSGETGFQPGAVGDSGTSHGLFQHHGPRALARQQWATANGLDPNDPTTEALFLDYEFNTSENYARQQLHAAQDPYGAAAAGLHFERPQGYSRAPGQFNPTAVSGWNNRLNSTQQIYNLLNQGPLPPAPESFQQAAPPAQPNPVDRPLPVGPDYAATNDWLNRAAPQPVDPAAQRQMMFNQILSGIASANAGVDTRGPGGTGRLIAALGAGAAGGKASGEERARAENETFKEKQQAYAGDRAGYAQSQANVTADVKNKVSETQWANMTDDQRTDFINRTSEFSVGQENKLGQFNARQANRENLYKYQLGAKAGAQGELKFMGNYVAQVNPDGSLGKIVDLRDNTTDALKYRAEIAQGKHGEPARLNQRYQEFIDSQDETGLKKAILEDVVASGAGATVFQENYQNAVDEANKIMARGQMGGSGDVQASKRIRDDIVSNLLWQSYYNQGEDWLQAAAGAQNPGAIALTRGQ